MTKPRVFPINVTVDLKYRDLVDVMTTAFDPGYGGALYWVQKIRRVQNEDFYTVSCQVQEDGDDTWQDVTLDTLAMGVRRILTDEVSVRGDLRAQIATLLSAEPDVDADGADCIVQAGLFDEVRYG